MAAAVVVFHLATAQIYGYHRDEFYYLASGRRLAWGYVDQPPITPLLYRVGDTLFGSSLLGLRIVPALVHAGIVVVTALLARELGATARGQVVAALAAAIAPSLLTTGHFLGTVSVEVLAWCAITFAVVRLLNGADPRWWLAVGLFAGLGMLDKWTTGFLLVGLAVGLALSSQRALLWTPWLVAGVAIACAVWAPNVVWQAQHGWPQLDAARSLRNPGEALFTAPGVLVLSGAAVILVLPGLWWLARGADASRHRSLGIALVVIVVLVTVSQGKPYYAGSFAPVLFAAGAAAGTTLTTGWVIAMVAWGVLSIPLAVPLLPVSTADGVRHVNKEIAEMVGWDDFVTTVDGVSRAHPGATLLAENYGEAGSIELLGHDRGMPQPISGHMTYWYWGHPHGRSTETVVVGFDEATLRRWFGDVTQATVFRSPHGIHNEEDGTPVWLCRDQLADWDTIWPDVRRF